MLSWIESKRKFRKDMQELEFKIHEDGSLRYKGRWCLPQKCEELKQKLMEEGQNTPYSVHPGGDKLYKDLKKVYWWPRMKNEVAEFVSRCLIDLPESQNRAYKTQRESPTTTDSKLEMKLYFYGFRHVFSVIESRKCTIWVVVD
ncbi:uncharacterized protein [Spinacia oleracea]|uniref:Integrase zinc-binding domain-containing protein n=1 Tax=Spinacia oleracea TaxID=3562 RepID=A0ABM3RRS0_SPIOL|nr:uncharacterized protein LOC130471960 [Spinacia oleracea]